MNFSLIESHIAWRYLFSKKGHNAINIVSGISAAAVVVVTAAMICVLSVMNGFGSLVEQMFSEFDPPLLVVPAEGQTLRTDTAPVVSLYAREDIQAVSMQLEQTALVRYKDHQLPARVRFLLGVGRSLRPRHIGSRFGGTTGNECPFHRGTAPVCTAANRTDQYASSR